MMTTGKLLTALALGFALTTAVSVAQAAEPTPPPGGAREGIQVHGDWVIEVRDPDGSFVSRTEFKNSLQNPLILVDVLRGLAAGTWQVVFFGGCGTDASAVGCVIAEPRAPNTGTATFRNLTVQAVGNALQLQGTAIVTRTTSITLVETQLTTCPGTTTPAACIFGVAGTNTRRLTSAPVTAAGVVPGQQVLVTVTLSFSTGVTPTTPQ